MGSDNLRMKDRGARPAQIREAQSALAFSLRRAFPLPSGGPFAHLLNGLDERRTESQGPD